VQRGSSDLQDWWLLERRRGRVRGAAKAACRWRPELVGGGLKVEQMKGRRDRGGVEGCEIYY
jgi:hypothetical protein